MNSKTKTKTLAVPEVVIFRGLVEVVVFVAQLADWPAILTKLSASFTATLCRTSNLFLGQPRSHILRCPQIVVLFAVLFVDYE